MDYKNKLLVATPSMNDPFFSKKVIFLASHKDNSVSGFALNGQEIGRMGYGDRTKDDVPSDVEEAAKMVFEGQIKSVPIFCGGPLPTGIFMVHAYENLLNSNNSSDQADFDLGIPSSFDTGSNYGDDTNIPEQPSLENMTIVPGIYFGTPDVLHQLATSDLIKEMKFKFVIGQSSWNQSQLDDEIKNGYWTLIEDFDNGIIWNDCAINELLEANKKISPKWVFGFDTTNFDPLVN